MIKGSCLCGGIRYEYQGEINEISMCHCSQCRKAQGSAFVAICPIESALFKITAGAELLKEFRAVSYKARVFCAKCGSPIYSARDDLPQVKRLRLGTIETPFQCQNAYHIYAESKASWHEITDQLPQYAEGKI
ncbi:MAG: GFA family protein [Moraxellaceae bacterium]|nr:GFA family protein [Moraxellaceae bacterium]MDP1776488.1 GFA family protein [Moraxellaceae bacterium]